MKRLAKSMLGWGTVHAGLLPRFLGEKGIIVAFHRVNETTVPITCTPDDFWRLCTFFKRHLDVVTLRDVVARIASGESVAGKLAITFDDGYRDNYEVARPILAELGLPATFFVTSGFIETDHVPAWDQGLEEQPGWMTWDQVRELVEDGHEIGGHTRTHVNLGVIAGDEAIGEIEGCRDDLLDRLGVAPTLFAYPFGGPDQLSEGNRGAIRDAGFACCVSCRGGTNTSASDPYRLNRIPIARWHRSPEQLVFEALSGAS